LRVAHYPKPIGPIFASRGNVSPRLRILAEGFLLSGADTMREDMYKVIVERPRRGKDGDVTAARLRYDFDGPMRLGMRAGPGDCAQAAGRARRDGETDPAHALDFEVKVSGRDRQARNE
jgi:hypothetical protein